MGQLADYVGDGTKTYTPGIVYSIIMDPVRLEVYDPDHENSKFFAATPGGSLQLSCVREEPVKDIEVGKEYFLDIIPA
jgi:hypothetical protein